ncbi:TonB-dependent receptor [Hymenobacter profundi]|uniref:TonB-dependent receptor n=1 Tax=Hymenobacter profundi TaxID=1982110 RepID=A0ABS6WUZ6_9BACT|nr:TonB-dependent receptor [Hymenobacter profundi]MBW3127387.1 TonB-dependent receptor [Hymenobacter profundi]
MKQLFFLLFMLLIGSESVAQSATAATIRGQVRAAGQPLEQVTVALVGTAEGCTTNAQGRYELRNVPAGATEIVFSFVGYQPVRRRVTVAAAQTLVLDATLVATPAALEEVVVTGVSRATELRRSPVPVAALNRRDINLNANGNVIDAAVRGVPGLNAVTTGPNISKPFIRGLGYNRVLTMYNGLRQEGQQWGDEHGIEIDQYDIERIEVVKGPASLIYGSDAVAGVVNLLPRRPDDGSEGQLHGDALTEYQTNNNLLGASVGLRYHRAGWHYGGRASYRLAQNYRNPVDGRVYGTAFRELNATGTAGVDKTWGSSDWSATLYDNHQEIPDGSRDSLSRRFTRQVLDEGDDIRNRPLVPTAELSTYRLNPLYQRIQHYRLLTRNRFRLGAGELHALLGVQQNRRREYNHPTLPEQPGLSVQLTTYNYDLRYAAPTLLGVEATAGLNGMAQRNRNQDATDFPIPDYNLFDIGGYIHLKKTFGRLDLAGGLRYDTRYLTWNDFYVGPNPATGFEQQVPAALGKKPQFAAFGRWYRGVSASVGGTYALNERYVLRANVARGYRAPNITEVGSNGLDPGAHIVYLGNRTFNPEFSLQQDLGLAARLPWADLSVDAFHNRITGYIYQARLTDANGQPVELVPGNATYQYQQSGARLYGAELTANLHPTALPGFVLNNSLAYVVGLNQNNALRTTEGNAAKYLPFIPPLQARSEARYTTPRPLGPFHATYVRATVDINAAQNRFYAVDNTETRTAGYTLLGLGAGTTLRSGQREVAQLFVQVDNVFNMAYQSHLNRLKYFEYYTASPNGRSGIYNQGRNVSVKVVVPL